MPWPSHSTSVGGNVATREVSSGASISLAKPLVTGHPGEDLYSVTTSAQVQEAGLTWQLGLISSTVYHMGAAVLPFRARLLAVLDSLFQAPSKARPRPSGVHGHAAVVCRAWTSATNILFPAHSKTRSRVLSR